ncbi:MAG: 3-deoxy-manno-octulosonate cytidylyltransferase [bacterium (Candidatus Ratteibacteria) CG_4_10_14_3_um_filter_41_18]|uniref:3-deoxy-manno-octulosonate cytidylyltransferase n=4 Tax=Candidatus Ratteibacteria TaxID=2979319 RepID=A0A2M7YF85_9BACT|nr:MAG: 3-deoxy-manno-octulosonate cytidylyltransferase [Candidatus Omnitrophica bacterium CG1_02_41_171]PIV63351.1 MAG: 3-deoxy-manno-octulosonate cytidylyltransferase [bacterium (Candidatus Ratteibacteria) CG01_land_8_20_14_3_00_40_19]PIW34243.1 MAG: 3-deoxy-manno-octulosonate cytidylyltransferase [bacterium (Candidatus Ratteibacteria) CG15_BIG_FIL_POST_REV_8_21_14_020_41_12]PIX77373.1 MAG: 3-deoxy-manno-octulosonate cytidylyltransferase [bacterium (Candidatus Ratteibacteria) CG_4_10_14_3_um_f
MKVIGVIPARFNSTRFPGKVLANLRGKPIIQHVYERAKKAKRLDEILIATDDERVFKVAEKFGAKVVMTSKEHLTGTDRVSEAVKKLKAEIVINIQADAPLINPLMIDKVAEVLLDDSNLIMATLMKRIEKKGELCNPNIVKVVTDSQGFALYFSRSPIPYAKNNFISYKHIGAYGYRRKFLLIFVQLSRSPLEKIENLEQLRALENGYKIKMIETDDDMIEIDTEEDLIMAKKFISNM